MSKNNLFKNIPQNFPQELIEIIVQSENFRIERIVSDGHTSPSNFWYDQDQNEFVLVLRGNAEVEFEDGTKIELSEGDYVIIEAYKKHRVSYTDTIGKTIWLTIFYK